eukprot:551123_1
MNTHAAEQTTHTKRTINPNDATHYDKKHNIVGLLLFTMLNIIVILYIGGILNGERYLVLDYAIYIHNTYTYYESNPQPLLSAFNTESNTYLFEEKSEDVLRLCYEKTEDQVTTRGECIDTAESETEDEDRQSKRGGTNAKVISKCIDASQNDTSDEDGELDAVDPKCCWGIKYHCLWQIECADIKQVEPAKSECAYCKDGDYQGQYNDKDNDENIWAQKACAEYNSCCNDTDFANPYAIERVKHKDKVECAMTNHYGAFTTRCKTDRCPYVYQATCGADNCDEDRCM